MLFTTRFIKDLVWIAVFSVFLYAITHNPISYPKVQKTNGLYSIEYMQYPLVLGIAGHNYLTLRDGNNRILRELHGLATDPKTNTWKYVGNSSSDQLKVWEFTSPDEYIDEKSYTGITLFQGSKEEVASYWVKALRCKERVNRKNIPYPPYGVNIKGDTENSNSVAYTLTLCMGLPVEHLGLITPGSTKNLLEEN